MEHIINHARKNEKTKKSRKQTKLSIIKAAINHIYTLQEILSSSETDESFNNEDFCEINQQKQCSATCEQNKTECSERNLPSLIPYHVLSKSEHMSEETYCHDDIEVKTEQDTHDNNIEYVIVDPNDEYKIIPVEMEYTTTSIPFSLIYLDCYAQ